MGNYLKTEVKCTPLVRRKLRPIVKRVITNEEQAKSKIKYTIPKRGKTSTKNKMSHPLKEDNPNQKQNKNSPFGETLN